MKLLFTFIISIGTSTTALAQNPIQIAPKPGQSPSSSTKATEAEKKASIPGNGSTVFPRRIKKSSMNEEDESEVENKSSDSRLGTGGLVKVSELLRKALPESQYKCAANAYLSALGMERYGDARDVGTGNVGLNSHFSNQIEKNTCFARIAENFYRDIDESAKQFSNFEPIKYQQMKPKLTESAGEGRYKSYPEGWLWEKAMKATGGNPNAAIALIGMCGNDDVSSGFSYKTELQGESLENWKTEKRSTIARFVLNLDQLRKKMDGLPDGAELKLLNSQAHRLSRYLEEEKAELRMPPTHEFRDVRCPRGTNPMYAPKSLSPDADLPLELKASIARVQRPGSDGSTLPAKAYHYMGSAYMGCQLAKCGISPEVAVQVQRTFASGYRALRLCPNVRSTLNQLKLIETAVDQSADDPTFQTKLRSALLAAIKKRPTCAALSLQKASSFEEAAAAIYCFHSGFPSSDAPSEPRVDSYLVEFDAARLYRNWYLGGGSAGGVDLPCTDMRLGGPDNLTESDYFENRPKELARPPGSMCGIPGWSSERCAKARAKLATWDVDFDWTKKQHEIGAKFGATHCRKQDIDEPLDKRMCSVLEQSQKDSSAGKSDSPPKANGAGVVQ